MWLMKKTSFIILQIVLLSCYDKRLPVKTGLEGNPLPNFTLQLQDSSTLFNSTSIPKDQSTVIFYFSPSCPYCRAQMRDIVNHIKEFENTHIYAVTPNSITETRGFYKQFKLDQYKNITLGHDYRYFLASYFKLGVVPTTGIYAKNGRLKSVFIGKLSARQIKELAED
jgi:peroxiredoxin